VDALKPKALCVFSGGLDSMLAAELIRRQGVDVVGLFFETPFFTAEKALKSAGHIRLPLEVLDISARHLEVVKRPKHGYGARLNPCIDCHALMFRVAGEMLPVYGAAFVFTGEVLGQRPLSQTRGAMNLVARESGLGSLLLRPLSAGRLPPSLPEERGWVSRDRLLDLQGRSRKPQMALAKDFGIEEFPSPAGGCLLTEKAFSDRMKDLLASCPNPELRQIRLLKLGRHFRIGPQTKAIVGRDRMENEGLRALYDKGDLVLTPAEVPGPTVLLVGRFSQEALDLAAKLTAAYSDAPKGRPTPIRVLAAGDERILKVEVLDKGGMSAFLI
jgi:hypothetical protein